MKTRQDFATAEEYIAYLEQSKAEMQAKLNAGNAFRFKVSDKGALSVYGLGRFPVTLYKGQWVRLFAQAKDIVAYMAEHDSELSEKPTETKAAA